MFQRRRTTTRLDALIERRGLALQSWVEPEVAASLAALRDSGVTAEVVGSFAQGRFRSTSDVDFLVLDSGGLSEKDVNNLVMRHLKRAPFDLIFADRLPLGSAALMLAHARSETR